jgi:signal transduction histidine kinase
VIRRGSPIVWAVLLAGPALVLALLGFRSVEQEDRLRRREAADAASAAADAVMDAAVARLDAIRRREEARPYYEYQARYMPADVAGVGPAFIQNSLGDLHREPADPTIWFRYVLAQGRIAGPEVFPDHGVGTSAVDFRAAYDSVLRAKLTSAAGSFPWMTATSTDVPLEVVAANEEVGQLLEEVEVSQESGKQTAYLNNFHNRVQARGRAAPADVRVSVRSTPIRYLAVPGGGATPALVAWRVVWIPGSEAKSLRDAPVDRWYLVGHAFLDPLGAARKPELPAAPGPLLFVGVDRAPVAGGWVADRRLGERLAVEGADPGSGRLRVTAEANAPSLDLEAGADRRRYLWTAAGLLSVVAIGLYVLFRSVRREVDAARRKQDFVAAVTHELKTPLAGIRMYADMLKEGWVPEGETTGSYADRIVDETKRLSGLVDQVLDFASFERGVASFQPIVGDFGAAVREAVELSTPAAEAAGVPVRVEIEPGLTPCSFDGTLVRPLVVNLVDNAIKYSVRSDTKDVVVSVRRDGERIALAIADRGVGIAAADRDRVFEPFFRSGDEMTRTARGVGIGLALVARYAKAHGALIELASEVGRGTTVTVRFPATPPR